MFEEEYLRKSDYKVLVELFFDSEDYTSAEGTANLDQ